MVPLGSASAASAWASAGTLPPIDPSVQSVNQLCGSNPKGVTDAEQGGHRNGPSGLDLLPMAGGKPKSDHVFLGISAGSAQLLYSLPQGTEELFLMDHPRFLGHSLFLHHEQISWVESG